MSFRGRRRKPFNLRLRRETVFTIMSVFFMAVGGLIMLSFSRQGRLLQPIYDFLVPLFGWGTLFLPFIFMASGLMLTKLKWRLCQPNVLVGAILIFISASGLTKAGTLGFLIFQNLEGLITGWGAFLIFFGGVFIGLVILLETSFEDIFVYILDNFRKIKEKIAMLNGGLQKGHSLLIRNNEPVKELRGGTQQLKLSEKTAMASAAGENKIKPRLPMGITKSIPAATNRVWQYPPLSLLSDKPGGKADRGDIHKNAAVIEKTLDSFGIQARVMEVNGGPAVTQYCLEIALGTKLSRITALSNDLALSLAAPTGQIRIEAPIPGRSMVGVEIPNRSLEFVTLKQILLSEQMKKMKSKLAVGLGLDVSGSSVVDNLERMPHVLIAGSTGSGKTVCLNAFVATILYRAAPTEVKLILIDPKRVEFTQFNGIPHLLTPVITNPEKVVSALKWSIEEMENRYKTFAKVGARNITAYNQMAGFQAMPYILIVIDELADIILFAPSDVEDAITRIAQMARATGIHLILSTQRPSVDVITGLIKANIPCRIAFNVTSVVDSRVILDMPGAEKLLGRGDMLYIPPDQAKPTRIQGAFVSDQEIQNLIDYLKTTGLEPNYEEEVLDRYNEKKAMEKIGGGEEIDELFEEAVRIICRFDRASASLLQRRLSIGYARAARLLDQLHAAGVVSAPEGSKPRDVLIKNAEEFLAQRVGGLTSEQRG